MGSGPMKRTSSQPMDLPQVRAAGGLLPWFLVVISLLNTALLLVLLLRDPASAKQETGIHTRQQQSEEAGLVVHSEKGAPRTEHTPEVEPEVLVSREAVHEQQAVTEPVDEPELADDEMTGHLASTSPPENDPPAFQPGGIRLQVLNGTETARLAAKAGDLLQRQGFDVREVGNARHKPVAASYIVRRQGSEPMARWLAAQLGLEATQIRHLPDSDLPDVDLSLVLGTDHDRLRLEGR